MAGLKYGVTLYSFSNEYVNGILSFEEILRKVKAMGYTGVEIVASQMVPGYPYPTDEYLQWLKETLDEIGLEPVCWSAYIDMGIRQDRDLTEDEIVQFTINDLICAKKAGFPMVRSQHAISPKIFRQMIPFCKELGVRLTIEMHHPHHPEVPVWKEYIQIMKTEGRGVLGFVPDMSIFQGYPHALWIQEALDSGCRKEVLDDLLAKHRRGLPREQIVTPDLSEIETFYANQMEEEYDAPANLDQLRELMDCVFYMHGKFYYINEDLEEIAIPYEEILPVIRDSGYDGFIACEYEGHHFDTTIWAEDQLKRYVAMSDRILGRA